MNWEIAPVEEWPDYPTWHLPIKRKTHEEGGFILLFLNEMLIEGKIIDNE